MSMTTKTFLFWKKNKYIFNTECCSFPPNPPHIKRRVAKRKERPVGNFLLYQVWRPWRINQGVKIGGYWDKLIWPLRLERGRKAGFPGTLHLTSARALPSVPLMVSSHHSLFHFCWLWSHSSFLTWLEYVLPLNLWCSYIPSFNFKIQWLIFYILHGLWKIHRIHVHEMFKECYWSLFASWPWNDF